VDAVEGLAHVAGRGSAAVMVWGRPGSRWCGRRRAVRTNFRIDQPVACSVQRLTARAANTMVRWASMESRWWWMGSGPPPAPPGRLSALQVQVEFLLPSGQALPGGGLQQLQLRAVGRPEVLDVSRPPPGGVHDLHRRRPRGGLHGVHVRGHQATLELGLVRRSPHRNPRNPSSARCPRSGPPTVSQVRLDS
jgi:hypothetical protein